MRIWLISDMHLEHVPTRLEWGSVSAPYFDILACAGDVFEGDPERCVDEVARIADGKPALLTLGNHDVYGLAYENAVANAMARNADVVVLDCEVVEIEGVRFAGATLWPDLAAERNGMPGFELVPRYTVEGQPWSEPVFFAGPDVMDRRAKIRDIRAAHEGAVSFLAETGADVVMSHYPPSPTDLERVHGCRVWLHGHVHDALDIVQDGRRIVRAPFGYGAMPGLAGTVVELD